MPISISTPTTSAPALIADPAPQMELSRPLLSASEPPCSLSTVLESQLDPVLLHHASTAPSQSLASASELNVGVSDTDSMPRRFMEPPLSGRAAEILRYSLDPTVAERAGKLSSFVIENYAATGEYLPVADDQQGTSCAEVPVEGHCSSKRPLNSVSGLRSYRGAMDFRNASSRLAVTAAKPEVRPNTDFAPVGGDLLGADQILNSRGLRLSSTHSGGGKRCVPQQIDIKTTPPGETLEFSPPLAPAAGDDSETQDAFRVKRGRLAHDEENLRKEAKERDQLSINSLLKPGHNNFKVKEEQQMQNRMSERKNESAGHSRHKTWKSRSKKVGDQPSQLDVIHVRARRGQATDSHSLAERVRREKISERMRLLQDLVPGCNKATGKAMVLDEIINYVQSLQNQVEFLAMKVAALNPRMDLDLDSVMEGEVEDISFNPSNLGAILA